MFRLLWWMRHDNNCNALSSLQARVLSNLCTCAVFEIYMHVASIKSFLLFHIKSISSLDVTLNVLTYRQEIKSRIDCWGRLGRTIWWCITQRDKARMSDIPTPSIPQLVGTGSWCTRCSFARWCLSFNSKIGFVLDFPEQ